MFVVTFIAASQNPSAAIVHHKVAAGHIGRTASQGTRSVHKVVAVIPETHGVTITAELHKILKSEK
jgi:hypothetical protein